MAKSIATTRIPPSTSICVDSPKKVERHMGGASAIRLRHARALALVFPFLVSLTTIAGCRDTTTPEPAAAAVQSSALTTKSALKDTLPFHIEQHFERAPDAGTIDCGSGITLPRSFRANGTLTPHLGRTESSLTGQSCSVSGNTVSLSVLAAQSGATGDTLFAIWIGDVERTTRVLTLQMVLVGGTGRFEQTMGSETATGVFDLDRGTGWYSGEGTIGPRGPLPPTGGVQLVPQTITLGAYHSCGLTPEGKAYCWGWSQFGLGDGTTKSSATPVAVVGGHTFTQITAGSYHRTCALTAGGDAYCWGHGFGLTPVKIGGGIVFRQIDVGSVHACGLTGEGRAYCWGWNRYGELGDGTTTDRETPVPVAPPWGSSTPLAFTQLSVGGEHTCGIAKRLTSTEVFCWGWNRYGQVGNGHTDAPSYAVTLPYGLKMSQTPVQVSAGDRHTCALAVWGGAMCWGANDQQQLGVYTYGERRLDPVWVGGGNAFTQIDAGDLHTCAVNAAGAAWCWGLPEQGQLGDGGAGSWPKPVAGGHAFTQVRTGGFHSCALNGGGVAFCWGDNDYGQLGDATTTQRGTPVMVAPFTFDRIASGGNHACALTVADAAYCWGANYSAQLGDGTTTQRISPVMVVGGIGFWQISDGYDHSCGLTVSGVAYCWGSNQYGQLGDGTMAQRGTPAPVSGGQVFARVRAGAHHSCGIVSSGAVYCWGSNAYGQLGDGTTTNRAAPVAAAGARLFSEIAVGTSHSCALTNAGEAYCWGNDGTGGYLVPNAVPGGLTFTQLTAGERFTCGLSDATAYCWGINPDGQLGDGTTGSHSYPTRVAGGLGFTQLSAGLYHVCGITASGAAYCWGWNLYGQLGDASTTERTTPSAVAGGLTWTKISGGIDHTCALTTSGAPYCWGRNDRAQLGDGTTTDHLTPRAVAGKFLFMK
jgi:alpha-tubulin suppressor-like RCC1 family protein